MCKIAKRLGGSLFVDTVYIEFISMSKYSRSLLIIYYSLYIHTYINSSKQHRPLYLQQ